MENIFSDPEPYKNGPSPWGPIQEIKELAPGIIRVYTARHGGIWVDFQHEKKIPSRLRNIARQYAPSQWYEEDCDALIVGYMFQSELQTNHPKFVEVAKEYIPNNERYKDALAQSILRNIGNKL